MQKINWGIIGCGDVTEVKSGPAFNKVDNSSLVAVMRRDAAKAEDYARRHNVPAWYSDAGSLINDPTVNAIYVATPPSSHEEYAIAAMRAGKPVYVEKPMTMDFASASRVADAAREMKIKLVVAHYRRAQPFFKKIKQLVTEKAVGDIRFIKIELYKKPASEEYLADAKTSWRLQPGVAGGGLFHDLAPHQLDLAYYFLGEIDEAYGFARKQGSLYEADDIVAGNMVFKSGAVLSGLWCFNVAGQDERDSFEIYGSEGNISFSIFGKHEAVITKNNEKETISFEIPAHVQQPMIEKVVEHFLDKGGNPSGAEEGAAVMRVMDEFTRH